MRNRFYQVMSALLVALTSFGCSSRGDLVELAQYTVGDTLFVETTPSSVTAPSLYSFQLDLTIGVEDGEEPYVLSGFDAVSEDEAGHIYLSNQRDREIKIFDSAGSFVRKFGRQGGGPGEFNSNYWGWFDVTPVGDDYLTVEDLPSLRVFDREGNYETSFDFSLLPNRMEGRGSVSGGIHWYPDIGKLITAWRESGPLDERMCGILTINEDLTQPDLLPRVLEPNGLYQEEGRGVSIPFSPSFHWTVTGDGTVVWGVSNTYRLHSYNLKTDVWTVTVLRIDPEPVTGADIETFKENFLSRGDQEMREAFEPLLNRMQYPNNKPFYNDIMGDDLGRIWVQRNSSSWDAGEQDSYLYDLFSSEGKWLGQVDSPGRIMHVRGDHAYMRGSDEFPTLVRYQLLEAPESP